MRCFVPGDDCVSVWQTVTVYAGMSLIIAVVDRDDIVVAADGLAIDENGNRANEESDKICRLNRRICLASTGFSTHTKRIMCALDPRCESLDEAEPENDWHRRKWVLAMGYARARDIIRAEFYKLAMEMQAEYRAARMNGESVDGLVLSAFALCGRDRLPTIFTCSAKPNDDRDDIIPVHQEVRSSDGVRIVVLGLPCGHAATAFINEKASDGLSCVGAEARLVTCIRHAVDADTKLRVNKNVLTTRLTEHWSNEWHIDVQPA